MKRDYEILINITKSMRAEISHNNPVDTRRRFNVYTTSHRRRRDAV